MQASSNSTVRAANAKRARPRATPAHPLSRPAANADQASDARVAGCTCFRVRRLARRVTQIYDRVLAPAGLRVTQFSLLSALVRNGRSPGAMAIGALATALDMDRTTLTRNLKPLIDAKLVALKQGEGDARQREASVTRPGIARYENAKTLWRQAQNDINRTLGSVQVASLHELVDGLLETLNEESARNQPDRIAATRVRTTSIGREKR